VALVIALILAGSTRWLANPELDLGLWLLAAFLVGAAAGEAIGRRQRPHVVERSGALGNQSPVLSVIAPPQPFPSTPACPPNAPREFVKTTIPELFELFKEMTALQMDDHFTQHLKCKWIRVSEPIGGLDRSRDGHIRVTLLGRSNGSVSLDFDGGYGSRLSQLKPNSTIDAECQLVQIHPSRQFTILELSNCELA